MHQCGPDYYIPICMDCLAHVVNQEIENIEEEVCEGIALNDKNNADGGYRYKLERNILWNLPFLGLNWLWTQEQRKQQWH